MKWIFTILICLSAGEIFATAQIPDILIYRGDTFSIYANPLSSYPDQNIISPKLLFESKGCFYTACWRNYVATWEIIEDQLYLKQIRNACYPTRLSGVSASFKAVVDKDSIGAEYADLQKLFPNRFDGGRVFAHWVSFEIINPYGKQIKYIHQGYDSIYEFERGFVFASGMLTRINEYDNRRSRQSKFTVEPDSLFAFLYRNINWKLVETLNLTDKKRIFVRFKTDEIGKPTDFEIVRGINSLADAEAERVTMLIPSWDLYFRKGELVEMQWTLPIILEKQFYEKKLKRINGG